LGDFWREAHYKIAYNNLLVKLGGSIPHYAKGSGSQTSLSLELKVKLWFMKVYNVVGCNKN
jgi:hypothetical protein